MVLIKPMSWERHGLKHWIDAARHRNVLAIALANKLARIAWGVLAGSRTFEAFGRAATTRLSYSRINNSGSLAMFAAILLAWAGRTLGAALISPAK